MVQTIKKQIKIQNLLIYSLPVIGLVITPNFSLDSVHIPKITLITLISSLLLSQFLHQFNQYFKNKLIIAVTIIWIISLIINILKSESPVNQLIFGREGRYNGAIIFLAIAIYFISSHATAIMLNFEKITKSTFYFGLITLIYSSIQLLGLDPIKWKTVNIELFGTFGNPNFLSAFMAMVAIPIGIQIFIGVNSKPIKFSLILIVELMIIFIIFKTKSYQGFIALIAASCILLITLTFKFKKIIISNVAILLTSSLAVLIVSGTLGHGPFGELLHKASIISRGDFFRSGISMISKNFLFGVGADSFGDKYLLYRDSIAANRPNAEFTDSAHNYFIDIFANFGIIIFAIYTLIILIVSYKLFNLTRRLQSIYMFSMLSIWVVIVTQSLVSPLNYLFLIWESVIAGTVLGINFKQEQIPRAVPEFILSHKFTVTFSLILSVLIISPLIIKDYRIKQASDQKSVQNYIYAVRSFPKGTVSYSNAIQLFLENKLYAESLKLSFELQGINKFAATGYISVVENPLATREQKLKAINNLIALDPKYLELKKFKEKI